MTDVRIQINGNSEKPNSPNDGANGRDGDILQSRPLFTEMAEFSIDKFGRWQWREAARWVKYEEDVEEGGQRWSKPFVPTVPLKSFYQLRGLLEQKMIVLLLDLAPYKNLDAVWLIIAEEWLTRRLIKESQKREIIHTLQSQKSHLYQQRTGLQLKSSENVKNEDKLTTERKSSYVLVKPGEKRRRKSASLNLTKTNSHFMKKMSSGSEAFMVLVGELSCLTKSVGVFLRFSDAIVQRNFAEVPLPTRFIFVLLGPQGAMSDYHDLGRSMATLMLDSQFREVAYTANTRQSLITDLNRYMGTITALPPPPEWDPSIRIEPQPGHYDDDASSDHTQDSGLTRTGRLFGGFVNDIKRKAPWYLSDFRDGLHIQCVATWLFLYFAALAPIITFGGLIGVATHNYMGTMETIVAASICGITFALFSGQPLLILGATGPMLIFEKILISFCDSYEEDLNLNYLELRACIGIWVGITLLIMVAVEASSLVAYITKFTEESFASLVACIFMVEAIKNLMRIANPGDGDDENDMDYNSDQPFTHSFPHDHQQSGHEHGHAPQNSNEVFLLSVLLFLGTFFISFVIKEFRTSSFFPTRVRYIVSDFAVIIAIAIMTAINASVEIETPTLTVPSKFAPTIPGRGWFINPFGSNPVWSIFAAIVPALLATILIFMDQQITAVIVNRKNNKLKKGPGYHLDLFVLAILIIVNSLLGLPWLVAATVESVTNLGSLKIESESSAPGEKPYFLGIREQRLSNLFVYITVGLSVFLTPALKYVPMPVLYGVFLYMGFSAVRKMELFERIQLFFIPIKYQPDHSYITQVPILKVHFFTVIQISCLVLLWVIKSIPATAILFPLMLLATMAVRKLLDCAFTQNELSALDDILPGGGGRKDESDVNLTSDNGNNEKCNNHKKYSLQIAGGGERLYKQ